ncbi:SDR family NAD(P)-dependent oxidoreductase [Halobellus rarus]|uniref:SDR family NAD(P)-dependent oxidoreductase n=1 Tax=Halobellus rarus TaxID=1126237 RepID=A0ABD6CNW6_9EURY|nr:SDR family oxidoreductase [Halobellus rarus]
MDLTKATVVVTGASRGIGRALLEAFAAEGAAVVGCARSEETLADAVAAARESHPAAGGDDPTGQAEGDTTAEIRGDAPVEGIRADVRDESDVERVVDAAAAAGEEDGIDVLVANAGVKHGTSGAMPVHGESYDRFDDTVETNLRGVFAAVKETLGRMPETGRVLVPSGSIAVDARAGMGAYAVSKAAAEALVRQLAVDAEQTAAVVDPGLVNTDLSDGDGRDPDDVAEMFVWAAAEADPDSIDGERIDLRTWMRATRSR